jgi:uncharacterized protein DUF6635
MHQNEDFQPNKKIAYPHSQLIARAVSKGVDRYINDRKTKVPGFVDTHFSFKGALKIHRKALGKDLYRAPLNILWLIPLTATKASAMLCKKIGASKLAEKMNRIPAGMETDVQKEINWLIFTELIELPYRQESRKSTKDALLETILQDPNIATVIAGYLDEIGKKSTAPDFRQTLERNLQEYATSRTAAADLAGSIITLSTTYLTLHKALPGALTSGSAAAATIAEHTAISNFWLGTTLGKWYYSLFSVSASTGLVISATASIIAGLALLTTFTGIITDPLQAKLGLHQKKLYKFLDALHDELLGLNHSEYKIKDQYIGRVIDIIDLLIAALRK